MIKQAFQIKKEIDSTEFTNLPVTDIVKYAPLLILALRFVKLFTGRKADSRIDEIISWLQKTLGIWNTLGFSYGSPKIIEENENTSTTN